MRYLLRLMPLLFLTACATSTDSNTDLTGKWVGVSWQVNGQPSDRDASQVAFEFRSSGTYTAAFGSQTEAGSYRVEGNKLYTSANGQVEKMVEVSLSRTDTLRMNMNRSGTPETLVLIRQ